MNSKRLSLMALAVVFVALFALQSMAGTHTLAAQATAAATQAPTATPAPTYVKSTEGSLVVWVDKDRTAMVEKLGADFTKKYNVPVRVQQFGFGDVRNNFVLASPVGEGPDVALAAHDWLGQYVSNGLVAEIDLGDKTKSLDPVGVKAFSYGGKQYGLPYSTEAIALYYNKDLIPTPPATWKEAIDIAKKLVADKKVDLGIAIPQDPYHHFPIISGFGGYVFGLDKAGAYNPSDVGLDSDGAIKAANELAALVKAGVLKEGVDGKDLFTKGKLAMFISGPWNLADVRKSGVNYGIAKIPSEDGAAHPFVGANGFVINKFSKNLLLAQAFLLDYVATDEGMQLLYDAVPANTAWLPLRAKIKDPDLLQFSASAADGIPMPSIPAMNSVWNAFGNAINLIYQQKGDPAQIMKDAAKSIRDEIAK